MIYFDEITPIPYTDPWNISFLQRLSMLKAGKKRVAYIYEYADYGAFRYRAYNMTQVLNSIEDKTISASYFFLDDLEYLDEIVQMADILIICRTKYNNIINRLITTARNRGKKVFFDIDDLLFNIDWTPLFIATLGEPSESHIFDFWFAYCARMGATLKQCDGVITTNAFLAEKIRDFIDIPSVVLSNFLNREQMTISDRIFEAKKTLPLAQDGLIHIGYFSGSGSHNRDFELVVPSLEVLLEENSSLGVVGVGFVNVETLKKKFGERIKYFPLCDFINLQRLIGSVEFNIVPLQYNAFTNCKSELKYFEAAVVGTQTIASPTYVYEKAINHQDNGYLSQAHQWHSTLTQAISAMASYQKMAERAHEHAIKHYAWYNQKHKIIDALNSLGCEL